MKTPDKTRTIPSDWWTECAGNAIITLESTNRRWWPRLLLRVRWRWTWSVWRSPTENADRSHACGCAFGICGAKSDWDVQLCEMDDYRTRSKEQKYVITVVVLWIWLILPVPGHRTFTTRSFTRGDAKSLGRNTDWAFDLELLVLGSFDQIGADLFQALYVSKGV